MYVYIYLLFPAKINETINHIVCEVCSKIIIESSGYGCMVGSVVMLYKDKRILL